MLIDREALAVIGLLFGRQVMQDKIRRWHDKMRIHFTKLVIYLLLEE